MRPVAWVVPLLAKPVPQSAKLLQSEIIWKVWKVKAKPRSPCSIKPPAEHRGQDAPAPPAPAAVPRHSSCCSSGQAGAVSEGQTPSQREPILEMGKSTQQGNLGWKMAQVGTRTPLVGATRH